MPYKIIVILQLIDESKSQKIKIKHDLLFFRNKINKKIIIILFIALLTNLLHINFLSCAQYKFEYD